MDLSAQHEGRRLTGVFGLMGTLDSSAATLIFVLLLILLILLEMGFHHLEHWARANDINELVEKLKEELMLMGLLSFTIFIYTQAAGGAVTEGSKIYPYFISFEMIHIVLLFVAIAFCAQASYLIMYAVRQGRSYLKSKRLSAKTLIEQVSNLNVESPFASWAFHNLPWWFPVNYPVLRKRVEVKLVERLFLEYQNRKEDFRFAYYISQLFRLYIAELGKVSPRAWSMVGLLVVLNYCRIVAVDVKFNASTWCAEGPIATGDSSHRMLGGGGGGSSLACPWYTFGYALFITYLTPIFTFGVLIFAKYYKTHCLDVGLSMLGVDRVDKDRSAYLDALAELEKVEEVATRHATALREEKQRKKHQIDQMLLDSISHDSHDSHAKGDHGHGHSKKKKAGHGGHGHDHGSHGHGKVSHSSSPTHKLHARHKAPHTPHASSDAAPADFQHSATASVHQMGLEMEDLQHTLEHAEQQQQKEHNLDLGIEVEDLEGDELELQAFKDNMKVRFEKEFDMDFAKRASRRCLPFLHDLLFPKSKGYGKGAPMTQIFLFDSPLFFFHQVELCLLFQSFYMAIWATQLVPLTVDRPGFAVGFTIPMVINYFLIQLLLHDTVILKAICEIHEDAIVETEEEEELEERCIKKMRTMVEEAFEAAMSAKVRAGEETVLKHVWLEKEFMRFDADGSGEISSSELNEFLQVALKISFSSKEQKVLWLALDEELKNEVPWWSFYTLIFPEEKSVVKYEIKYLSMVQGLVQDKMIDEGVNASDVDEFLTNLFKKYDADGSGSMDISEFKVLISDLVASFPDNYPAPSEKDFKAMFCACDFDKVRLCCLLLLGPLLFLLSSHSPSP